MSKSGSADPKIANITERGHLLENVSSTADKTHKPSTRSTLVIVCQVLGPPCDGTNPKTAVSKSLKEHRSSPASSRHPVRQHRPPLQPQEHKTT